MAGRQRSFSTARVLKTSLGLDGAISTNFRLSWVIVLLVITKGRVKPLSFCNRAFGANQTLLKNENYSPKEIDYT